MSASIVCVAGRDLKELISAYQRRDDLAFRRATQALIEEQEAKKHTALARDLRRMLASSGNGGVDTEAVILPSPPRDRDTGVPLAELRATGRLMLEDLVLDSSVQAAFTDLVRETQLWPELDAAGVPRRQRLLLHGPPGCGKTSAAEGLANELGLPLAVTRVDSLMSSFLGETAANLRSLFEFARGTPCVLLLDEFDSIGKVRSDSADHGELRRIVNAVLQMIEGFEGSSLIVAATNAPEIIDYALWRRFDEVVQMKPPAAPEICALLAKNLPQFHDLTILKETADKLVGLPHAAVTSVAYGAQRSAIKNQRKPTTEDLDIALTGVLSRPWG